MNTYERQFRLDTLFNSLLVVAATAWLALGSVQDAARLAPAGPAVAALAAASAGTRGAAPGAAGAQCTGGARTC